MEESRFVSVKCKLETYGQEITMAGSDTPFPLSEMMTQGFEQTRKAMENYFDFFEKNIRAAPWLDTNLNEKMKTRIKLIWKARGSRRSF
jgi:ABC-type phosphate transport system substrate-binding protein